MILKTLSYFYNFFKNVNFKKEILGAIKMKFDKIENDKNE